MPVQVNDRLIFRGAIYRVVGPLKVIETVWGEAQQYVPVVGASPDAGPIRALRYPDILHDQRWAVESADGKWWRQMPDEYEIRDRGGA